MPVNFNRNGQILSICIWLGLTAGFTLTLMAARWKFSTPPPPNFPGKTSVHLQTNIGTTSTGNLFKPLLPASGTGEAPPQDPPWISRRLGLELKGTVSDQMAVVKDLDSGREHLLHIGDSYGQGTVKSISRNQLIIETAAFTELMELPADKKITSPGGPETVNTVSRSEIAGLLTDISLLAREISLQPVQSADGDLFGYKISAIKPQGVLARMGLRKNDILLALNHKKPTSPEDVHRILESAYHANMLTLDLRRNQRDLELTFQIQ